MKIFTKTIKKIIFIPALFLFAFNITNAQTQQENKPIKKEKVIPVERPVKASTSMSATFTPVENNVQKTPNNTNIDNAESVENNILFKKFIVNEDTLRDVMIKSKEITTPEK